jgi:hypothetical protein
MVKKTVKSSLIQKSGLFFVRSDESYEKQLFAEIKRLIRKSHQEDTESRKQTLKQAEELQVQLSARLERSGCYYLSQHVFEEIAKLRNVVG